MRIKIDHFLAQFAIEARHHGNDENQHRYAEHHAYDRDQRDDRNKRALWFQIPQRQEETKRKLQFRVSVAANSIEFNRRPIYSESAYAFNSSSVTNSSADA